MRNASRAITALAGVTIAATMVLLFVQLRSSYMSCDIARAQDLQRAGRERLAIEIWRKKGIPEIGVVWRGMASDDEAAAAACTSH